MSNLKMVEWVKEHKVRVLVGSVAAILAIVAMIVAGCASSCLANVGADPSATETIAEDLHDAEAIGGEGPEFEVTQAEDENDADSAEGASNEDEAHDLSRPAESVSQSSPQSVSSESKTVGGSSPAQSVSSQASQKKWVEDTEKVWVVDSAAWTEQVPICESKERAICNICGADITGNTTAHSKAHMLAMEGSGYHSEVIQVVTGYNTVQHPEAGHWETRVTGGHWE